jgi:hypothetical protein
MSASEIVVFLGPSLALARARKVLSARYLPPARQGDVFKVLVDRPRVIVLIDGVFESVPSVWHHELRAALACGVHVIGAASMGALRAAELHAEGMLPVGRIAGEYVRGDRRDDADVAVLHGLADSGRRALTVPLVNVDATLTAARQRRVVTPAEARRLGALARETFFKERTWRTLVAQMPWSAERARQVVAWLRSNTVDQKALDAEAALRVAGQLRRRAPRPVSIVPFSSYVRRKRLLDVHGETMARLERRPDADTLARQGLRRLLLAAFARMGNLEPGTVRVGVDRTLAVDEALSDAQVLALEAMVLSAPERFVPDGPSWVEGLALEARIAGHWKNGRKRPARSR